MERISIEDFAKIDMRVGQILEAERVSGSKRLVKLIVDIGEQKRQVVAGIGEQYPPESLVNKKIVVVVNLQPRSLMGVQSDGMIVAASTADGQPVLTTFVEDVPNGARLK